MSKVTVLLPSLRGGGTERQGLTLAQELSNRGWDLDLVLINRHDSAYSISSRINVVDLNVRHIRCALLPLMRYLRRTRPAVMYCAETPVNVLAIMARRFAHFPTRLIVSERNHLSSVARHTSSVMDRIRPLLVRLYYPRADEVVAVSMSVADDLEQAGHLPRGRIRTIYNMFDVDDILQQSRRTLPAQPSPIGEAPVILSTGRLTKQKDHGTLLRAFSIVRAARPCRLVILGDGPQRSHLQRLAGKLGISDDLSMPGFVENPYAHMAAASVFVLSSAWEGLPGVLIEAMACGVPVISTRCPGGSAEILEDGRYGALTPVGDAPALAAAILKTLADPPSPDSLRGRARDYSVERIIPQFIELMNPDHDLQASAA